MMLRSLILPVLLPLACSWIARQERRILETGVPLSGRSLGDARSLGIVHPEKVRLLCVREVPLPGNPITRAAGLWTGTLSRRTSGLSARHGIFIRADCWGDRYLITHELVHTAQYERLGGIRPFLREYLGQCLTVGYEGAALEREAVDVAHEMCG